MPDPQEILAGLTRIANEALPLAVAWHLIALIAGVALARGWRPSRRVAGALLALPLASVSALAFAYGNPFNGVVFAALALLLAGLALRLGPESVARGATWSALAGAGMIAFGWLYPHFLEAKPVFTYLFGAPTGLIPCPTLALVLGAALLAGGLGSRLWSLPLAAAGLFYGVLGAARLGVRLDLVLVAGAAALLVQSLLPRHPPGGPIPQQCGDLADRCRGTADRSRLSALRSRAFPEGCGAGAGACRGMARGSWGSAQGSGLLPERS